MFVCYLAAIPDLGNGFQSKPWGEIRSWSRWPKALRHWLQHRSGNSCDSTGARLYGLLPFPWITPGTPKGGTSVTWRGGDLLHGQQLVFHITLAQACAMERTLQRRRKATTQHEKCAAPVPTDHDFWRRRSMATRDRRMPQIDRCLFLQLQIILVLVLLLFGVSWCVLLPW